MTTELQQLQDEMNVIMRSLMSRGILTKAVYNRLCSEYAVKFTKLLAQHGIKHSVTFTLAFDYQLPTTAKFMHKCTYEDVRDSLNFFSRSI